MTLGRNDPCHCGTGKKYKKCCESKDQAKEHAVLEKQWDEALKVKEKETPVEDKTGDKPTSFSKKSESTKTNFQKHSTLGGPKMTMPRKSGGG